MSEEKVKLRDKQAKIDKIIAVTKKLIINNGYSTTSTNRIAKESDVSIGLVYKYFPEGKSRILKTIVQNELESGINEELLPNSNLNDLPKSIMHIIEHIVQYHRANEALAMAMELATLTDKRVFKDYEDQFKNQLPFFLNVFDRISLSNTFENPEDAENWGILLAHMIDSLVHRHIFYGRIFSTDEEFIRYLSKLILKILLK